MTLRLKCLNIGMWSATAPEAADRRKVTTRCRLATQAWVSPDWCSRRSARGPRPFVCIVVLLLLLWTFGVEYEDAYTGLAITAGLLYYIFMRSFAERGWDSFTSRWQIATHVWLAWIAVVCVLLLLGYATKLSAVYSRLTLFAWFLATPPAVALVLVVLQAWHRRASSRSGNARSVVIAGVNEISRRLANNLQRKPEFGLSLRAFFDDRSEGRLGLAGSQLEAPLLGGLSAAYPPTCERMASTPCSLPCRAGKHHAPKA